MTDLSKIDNPIKRVLLKNSEYIRILIYIDNDVIMLNNILPIKRFTNKIINSKLSKGNYKIYNRDQLQKYQKRIDIYSYINLIQSMEITINDCLINDESKREDLEESLKKVIMLDKNGNRIIL